MISNFSKTQIDGDFNGWDGETIFKLADGTIWQQNRYDINIHFSYRPDVIIFSRNGRTYMKVEGVDDEVSVVQLK